MKEKINQQEKKIEAAFMLMSSKKELENVYNGLRIKYENIKEGLVDNPTDFELKKYYAELLSFTEMELNYVMNLFDKQTGNRNIFDLSQDKVDEKIEKELEALKKIIVYMKQEFPKLGNILEKRLMELESSYRKDLEKALVYDKSMAEATLGINKKIALTLTGSVDRIELKYLLDLQIFAELLIGDSKKIISMDVSINNKYNEMLEMLSKHENRAVSKLCKQLTVLFAEYKKSTERIDSNGDIDVICSQLAKKIKEYNSRLEQFEEDMKQAFTKISMEEYYDEVLNILDSMVISKINISEIQSIITKLIENNLLTEEVLERFYSIIELELIAYRKSKLYTSFDEAMKLRMEKIFFDKLKIQSSQGVNVNNLLKRYVQNKFDISMMYDIIKTDFSFDIDIKKTINSSPGSKAISKYKEVRPFMEGLAAVMDSYGSWGFIDRKGDKVINLQYRDVGDFHEGLASVQDFNNKWGFIDKFGNEVIRSQYKSVKDFHEELAAVSDYNGRFSFINLYGREVIKCHQYEEVCDFQEGLAVVRKGICFGFIDKSGNEVVNCQYKNVVNFQEELAAVRDHNNKWGFIDKLGNEVIKCQYKDVGDFQEGLAAVRNHHDKWGFIDKLGNEVIKCQYKLASDFQEGLVAVIDSNGHWAFINEIGKMIIKGDKYKVVYNFHEGLALVLDFNDNKSFIDKKGNIVIECHCQYKKIDGFQDGIAAVQDSNDKWGAIDRDGNEIIKCQYATREELNVAMTIDINVRDKQLQLRNLRSKIQYISPLVEENKSGKK